MSREPGPVRVAMLGCGTVGAEVVRLLQGGAADFAARVGAPVELVGIAVRRMETARGLPVDSALFTTDAAELVRRPDLDVVIEVMGGIEPARTLLTSALTAGTSVVTANKALLAQDGAALHVAARAGGADLYYEASVGGAIPLLRLLRDSLAGDQIRRVMGIVNGTTNYILTLMDESGSSLQDALAEATDLGYAEADPTADIEGYDAAAKAAIIAGLAFHTTVTADDVHREGIASVTADTVASARAVGCVVKLLAIAESGPDGVGVRVHPAMVPRTHPLAGVRGADNAVFVEGASAGQLMFSGRGAGGSPTASAVLGDVVAVARNRLSGATGMGAASYVDLRLRPIGEAVTRYHIDLDVADKAGVLAAVAATFAAHQVSISTVRQEGRDGDASLVVVTHAAPDAALQATVADLRHLDTVRAVASVLRVEGEA
ncbi:MAG TPA: homoserine dehydrogenase [Mycobacteriales bacterium]|nr:homoserine dehydrogenase [Mycobacteriales bacterium]